MIDDIKACYKLLEIEPGCSVEELKRSRKELVQVWHPDRFSNDERLQIKAEERVKQINAAYDTLYPLVLKGGVDSSLAQSTQTAQKEFFNRPFAKIDGDEVRSIPFSRRHLGIWTVVLAAFLGLLASILIIKSQKKSGISEYEELIAFDAAARKKNVVLEDKNDLFRYQTSQRIQQKLNFQLEKMSGTNRFRTKVELEVEPESKVILLMRISILIDGDGQYNRDEQGGIIGEHEYQPCTQSCADRVKNLIGNMAGIRKNRGDTIDVYTTDFSKSIYARMKR